ncbi:MAG: hypothetical protein SGI88_21990 [Candidatus Hydrogenedentes bacterium]|nr:hypothetical protein [Candidatus Hydrogenedentota bacterium]
MPMARILITLIIALPVGAVAGMFYANQNAGMQLAQLQADRDALKASQSDLKEQEEKAREQVEALEREKRHLEDQLASASKPKTSPMAELEEVAAPGDTLLGDASPEGDASVGDGRDRVGDGDENDPERQARMEEWRQEREQRGAEMRQRMDEFMANEIQNAPDKATQDRLAAMNDYSQGMMDLFQQMRDAETDEERDAIRAQLQENGTAARELVREHQDQLMRQSLTQSGVTDASAQDAAMQSLRQTMEGPFFRGPMAGMGGWGGDRGGGDRGRGDWGGRGRGPSNSGG